jgi:hypothetical protein
MSITQIVTETRSLSMCCKKKPEALNPYEAFIKKGSPNLIPPRGEDVKYVERYGRVLAGLHWFMRR